MRPSQLTLGLEVSLTEAHLRAAYARTRLAASIPFEEAITRHPVYVALWACAKAALSCRSRGASSRKQRR